MNRWTARICNNVNGVTTIICDEIQMKLIKNGVVPPLRLSLYFSRVHSFWSDRFTKKSRSTAIMPSIWFGAIDVCVVFVHAFSFLQLIRRSLLHSGHECVVYKMKFLQFFSSPLFFLFAQFCCFRIMLCFNFYWIIFRECVCVWRLVGCHWLFQRVPKCGK